MILLNNTIVTGVLGADCHSVGNIIIEKAFSEAGFNVINIGVLSSQEEFITAAISSGAGAILVSSLYGHGETDARGFRKKCIELGAENILLYIGGNLVVGKQDWAFTERKFKSMGFNRIYSSRVPLECAINDLKKDLITYPQLSATN